MKTASSTFRGFPAEGVAFLRDLKANNHRDWFTPRVEVYREFVHAPMLNLVSAVHHEMLRFAPEYVGEPAKCLFRIYRDTRFSKDKTPYKTAMKALMWHRSLEKNTCAAFYFSIAPDELGVAGGLYGAPPPALLAVRQAISNDLEGFRSTFESKAVRRLMGELKGEQASRVPRGFRADDPAADILKRRHLTLYQTLDPALMASPKLVREIASRIEVMTPFARFIDAPLLPRKRR